MANRGDLVNLRCSKFLSGLFLLGSAGCWLVSVIVLAKVLEHGEITLTDSLTPKYTLYFLAITAPALAMSAMASPLKSVAYACSSGSPDHGLQWRLFLGFASSCVLGLAYGFRQSLGSVMASCGAGLIVQCVSLGGVYHLSLGTNRTAEFLTAKILPSADATARIAVSVRWILKWGLYLGLLMVCVGSLFMFAMVIPLETWLAPIYGASCVFPYVATFSTLARDIRSWRNWHLIPVGHPIKGQGPPGVDMQTLWFMQVNNTLWCLYGLMIFDPAILGSAVSSIIAAGIQLICYLCPLIEMKYTSWQAVDYSKPRSRIIRIDPAYLFVGAEWIGRNDPVAAEEATRQPSSIAPPATNEFFPLTTTESVAVIGGGAAPAKDVIEMSGMWYDRRMPQTEPVGVAEEATRWRPHMGSVLAPAYLGESGGPSPYQHEDSTSRIGEWGSLQSRGADGRE